MRVLPDQREARKGAFRLGRSIPPRQRSDARTPQLAGRYIRIRGSPLLWIDGELRVSPRRPRAEPRIVRPRLQRHRLSSDRAPRQAVATHCSDRRRGLEPEPVSQS